MTAIAYRLTSDGTTVTAYDKTGTTVASGTDGGAVLTAILPAAASVGAAIGFRNDGQVFPWATTPALPKGITGKLLIDGGGATIQFGAARRFLDFNRTADYDTFQNIEIRNFVVDCNNVASSGREHVVIGTSPSGVYQQRINVNRLTVRNVRTVNVPTHATNIRLNIGIGCVQPTNNEGTQNTLTDLLFEDLDFSGGNVGVLVTGSTASLTDTLCNVFIDRVIVQRWKHTTGAAQSAAIGSSNVQIGQQAFGGRCTIKDGRGDYSGDVGIEVDGMTEAVIENVEIHNALNYAFYATNFRASQYPSAQTTTWKNCTAVVDDVAVNYGSSGAKGWAIRANNSIAHGSYVLKDCRYNKQIVTNFNNGASFSFSGATVKHICVDGFTHIEENLDYSSGSAGTILSMIFASLGGTPTIELRDIYMRLQGTRSGGGALSLEAIRIDGAGTYVVNCDRLRFEHNFTGLAAATIRYLNLGPTSGSSIRGTFKRIECVSLVGDTTPTGVRVRASTLLTIPNSLEFWDCDFSQFPAGGTEFTIDDNANKVKTYLYGTKWITFPRPSAAVGTGTFATASFTTATANQYIGGFPAEVHFANGTGAAITKIEASKDNSTFEAVWDQASGVLAQDVVVPVDNGDSIKITFATTQPTARVRPRR